MAEITVRQGYDLKLKGRPTTTVSDLSLPRRVGIRPLDFPGLKLRPMVEEGANVRTGTAILQDKSRPEIVVASPATGTIAQIKRGPRRSLLEVVIDATWPDEFEQHSALNPQSASADRVRSLLLQAGLWPLIRQHPYAKVADPKATPKAIFVSSVETEPFVADPNVLVHGEQEAFQIGLDILTTLSAGGVHLTTRAAHHMTCPAINNARNVIRHTVSGPHPAGNPAVQAFYVDRLKPGEVVWCLGAPEVLAIGQLCRDGRFPVTRTVCLAGTGVEPEHRHYYRTRVGTQIAALTADKMVDGENRFISGGVLTGTAVAPESFLGFRDWTVTVIPEGGRRELLGWLRPGAEKYSWSRAFLSAFAPADREFDSDTSVHGGERACIQSGYCLKVCPTDVQPLFVWKAVWYKDLVEAEQLGILDCVDCGLCTYVCPSKIEIGSIIKEGLELLEQEG